MTKKRSNKTKSDKCKIKEMIKKLADGELNSLRWVDKNYLKPKV